MSILPSTSPKMRRRGTEWREEKRRQTKEENAKATADVDTSVDEKLKGKAEKVSAAANIVEADQSNKNEQQPIQPKRLINNVHVEEAPTAVKDQTGAPGVAPEDENYEPISATNLKLVKAIGTMKVVTAAKELITEFTLITCEAKHTEAKVETNVPVHDADIL